MSGFPPNLLFSVLSFAGFLLVGLSLPWYMDSWHMGTCMYMLWTSLGRLILFVDSIIWNDNVTNWAPVWCDISTRFLAGASAGIPASSLCIIRRLYYLTKLQTISFEKEEKKRVIMVDASIGIGLPCVMMVLLYVVQGHRFIIYEQVGCYYFVVNSVPALFLFLAWPVIIGLVSLVYAVLTFHWAYRQRVRLKRMLRTGFFISTEHYWLLMAICCSEIIFTVPLGVYFIAIDSVDGGVAPYVSWAWVHSDFSHIIQVPTTFWQDRFPNSIAIETSRWAFILCAFVIFAFFGWPEKARKFYRQAFWSICRCLGIWKVSSSPLPITPAYNENRHHTTSTDLSIPARARVRRYPLVTSVEFAAPPRSESPGARLGVDEGSIGSLPRLPSLSSLARHTKISWESLIAVPEPALSGDRRSLQDVDQLV